MSTEMLLFVISVFLLLYLWAVRLVLVGVLKEVVNFYFERRLSFLQDLEKKVDGEVARSVFN